MRLLPCLTLVSLLSLGCAAPDAGRSGSAADREAVLAVMQTAFDAIAQDDIELWRQVLLPTGYFSSVRGEPGARELHYESFAEALAHPPVHDEAWLERWWEPTVLLDGDVAMVWTRYDFHAGGRFSHGGTDVAVLLRTDAGWRIASFAWTVEPTPAEPSPLGPVTAD